jgi:hypothetical protein
MLLLFGAQTYEREGDRNNQMICLEGTVSEYNVVTYLKFGNSYEMKDATLANKEFIVLPKLS